MGGTDVTPRAPVPPAIVEATLPPPITEYVALVSQAAPINEYVAQVSGILPVAPPAPAPQSAQRGEAIQIRYSHYWPPLGGVNTSRPSAPHLARCANGDRWQDWVGKGCACPREWPFGTQVILDGKSWACVDRGGMIKTISGVGWVDFLTPKAAYGYGTIVPARIVFH